jgi:hypothetical protein
MAWYDKYIPKEIKKPIDKFLDFGTDTFKKTGRAVRKLTPRELRPALPFLASAVPFMLPGAGLFASPLYRGIASALANATSQEALDPEGDINYLSTALSGLTGAGTAPGASEGIRGLKFTGDNPVTKEGILSQMQNAPIGADSILDASNVGMGKRLANLGLEGAAQVTDFLGGSQDTFSKIGDRPELAFTKEGAKELGKALSVPAAQGSGDLAYAFASKAMRDFEEAELEELRQAGLSETEMMLARRDAITSSMLAAAFDQDEIDETLDQLGLLNFANGGIASLKNGGIPDNEFMELVSKLREDGFSQEEAIEEAIRQLSENMAQGGIIGLKEGGMLDFGGREMDLRGGGFVPIGKKERADDVPARLSKNEFVMTADAVRAAGGGSVNKGAQRMYDIMNRLEARA